MPRRSMVMAPPYDTIRVAGSMFGTLISHSSGEPSAPRSRWWLIIDEPHAPDPSLPPSDAPLQGRFIVYRASPADGALERLDLGLVSRAETTPHNWEVTTALHGRFTGVVASCVCGGGAIAYAGPVDQRHALEYVRTDPLKWLTVR